MVTLCNRCNMQHGAGICPNCGCPEYRLVAGPDEDGDDEPGADLDEVDPVEPYENPLLKRKQTKRKPPPRSKKRGKKT